MISTAETSSTLASGAQLGEAVRMTVVKRDLHLPEADSAALLNDGCASVPVRVYVSGEIESWATLVWAHGGSFIRGDLDWPEADWVATHLAEAGIRVYSVAYRLATDTIKAPLPERDLAAVFREVRDAHSGAVLLGGASAGGYLATAAALYLANGSATPSELVLVYPTLHRVQPFRPDIAELTAKLPAAKQFDAKRIAEMYETYLGTQHGSEHVADGVQPTTVPTTVRVTVPVTVVGETTTEQLAVLPETIIVNAEADDLRASGEAFAAQLRHAGVRVTELIETGTVHGYLNIPHEDEATLRASKHTIDCIVREIRAKLVR